MCLYVTVQIMHTINAFVPLKLWDIASLLAGQHGRFTALSHERSASRLCPKVHPPIVNTCNSGKSSCSSYNVPEHPVTC